MLPTNKPLSNSPFSKLYDILVPKDDFFRRLKEDVDFSFVLDIVKDTYCHNNGAMAKDPILMFKLLFLKAYEPLSDVDLIQRAFSDMRYKFFLDLNPEDEMPDPSLLTYFRKLRLKDNAILNQLIVKTLELAKAKGVLKSKTIILDSTHTKSAYVPKSPVEQLVDASCRLRKSIYEVDETVKDIMPQKPNSKDFCVNVEYCKNLINRINNQVRPKFTNNKIETRLHYLEELIDDAHEFSQSSIEKDARIGHKSKTHAFFGYKNHFAINGDRLITAALISPGNNCDPQYAIPLLEQTISNGIEVHRAIGDAAYSSKAIYQFGKDNNIDVVSKLTPQVYNNAINTFVYDKDAKMFFCKGGFMATEKKITHGNKAKYTFDKNNCITCKYKPTWNPNAEKDKIIYKPLKGKVRQDLIDYQQSKEFKLKYKERYKIEAKNSELKHQHGLDVTRARNTHGITIQSAMAFYVVNIKRIYKLLENKENEQ